MAVLFCLALLVNSKKSYIIIKGYIRMETIITIKFIKRLLIICINNS